MRSTFFCFVLVTAVATTGPSSANQMSLARDARQSNLNIDLMSLLGLASALKVPLTNMLKDAELTDIKELLETVIPILQCADADIGSKLDPSLLEPATSNNSGMIASPQEKRGRSVNRSGRSDEDTFGLSERSSRDESRSRRRRKKKTKKPSATRPLMPSEILVQSITTCAFEGFAESSLFQV